MSCTEEVDKAPFVEMARLAAVAFINERFPDIESLEHAPQTLNELTSTKVNLERAVCRYSMYLAPICFYCAI